MSVVVKNRRGKDVTLLNPAEKGNKYATELAYDVALTNDGEQKVDKHGRAKRLKTEQRAFRAGYLQAQKDSAKAFKHNHPDYKRKTGRK